MTRFNWIIVVVCGVLLIITATQFELWSAKRKLDNHDMSLDALDLRSGMSPERFELYLKAGFDMNTVSSALGLDDVTVLQRLIMNGQNLFARKMIEKGMVHALNHRSQTALMTACLMVNEDIAKLLVEKGADVNASDNDGMTPLHFLFEPIPVLISSEDSLGDSPEPTAPNLNATATEHQPKLLDFLLGKGANPAVSDIRGRSVLAAAIRDGSPQAVRMILKRLPKPDLATDAEGETLLHAAVASRNPEMVELVLKEIPGGKALLNNANSIGTTPAAMATNSSVLHALAKAGANLQSVDRDGDTLLHRIVMTPGDTYAKVSMTAAALRLGADPSKVNNNGETPLEVAAASCTVSVLPVLLEKTGREKVSKKRLLDAYKATCENDLDFEKAERIIDGKKTCKSQAI